MAGPTWKKLLTSASIQRSSQTLAVVGETAYLYGGELRPREPVDSTIYSISVNANGSSEGIVSPLTGMTTSPQPRVGAASTAVAGKIYMFSGRGGTAMAPIEEAGMLWMFDPVDRAWSQVKPKDPGLPYPAGRSYHSLASDGGDTIFLHAGCPESGRLRDLWAFDISHRRWRELTPAPGPERGGTSIAYAEGRLFRMNGFDGEREQGGALDVFDPAADQWHTLQYSADGILGPSPRSVSCLLSLKIAGRPCLVTMFGEHDPSSLGHQGAGKMLADVWAFDIGSQAWRDITVQDGDKPPARGWFAADVVRGDGDGHDLSQPSVVVQGGLAESNERLGDAWLLSF